MKDVNQILWQAVKDSVPEFTRLMFAGLSGGLIGAYANDRLTRRRDRESGIMEEKLKFIPQLDALIDSTSKCDVPEMIRREIRPKLYQSAMRFRIHLKGRRLNAFNKAWETLINTTGEEIRSDRFFKAHDPELTQIQQLLVSRFQAVKKIVKDS